MESQYLKDKFENIANTVAKAKTVDNLELASMLSNYLICFISGTYEDCIEYLFIQRAKRSNDKELISLVEELIAAHFRDPTYEKIRNLVRLLNPLSATLLDSKIDIRDKEGINSISRNRNEIVHYGRNPNVTINDVVDFHNRTLKIFEELERMLL